MCTPLRPFVLLLAAAAAAQNPVLDALRDGALDAALRHLDAGATCGDPAQCLETCALLHRLAADSADRERALRWAMRLLPDDVADELVEEQRRLGGRIGRDVARVLVGTRPIVDGRIVDRTQIGTLLAARRAMIAAGERHGRDLLALDLHLLPLLNASSREREAAAIAEDALEGNPSPNQEHELRRQLVHALLGMRRYDEALAAVPRFLAGHRSAAGEVLPIVEALPPSMAESAYELLVPVLADAPATEQRSPAWTACLAAAYANLDRLDRLRPPGAAIWDQRLIRRNLPQVWFQRKWDAGFRVWLDDNARPGKVASGKDSVVVGLPLSAGWRQVRQPPDDLSRWDNAAVCLQRAANGPVVVVYWFGPNLHYWYGDTPRQRGVTAKTVRGHSAGAVARMIAAIAYGEDAAVRGVRFDRATPLPFPTGVAGKRMAWTLGSTIYDETVFSHGQVTIEVLLRIDHDDLTALEPEIRWLYRTFGKG